MRSCCLDGKTAHFVSYFELSLKVRRGAIEHLVVLDAKQHERREIGVAPIAVREFGPFSQGLVLQLERM